MSQPTREEVEAFITALNYGMKVSHKPEFLIALAEGWLENNAPKQENIEDISEPCSHSWARYAGPESPMSRYFCEKCGLIDAS